MVIDFHTHTFPDKIAARTVEKLKAMARAKAHTDATCGMLVDSMHEAGVDCSVVLPVATNVAQSEKLNEAAYEVNERWSGEGLLSFGAIHPAYEDYRALLHHIADLGLKGIKLHPDMQRVNTDDPRLMRIYEAMEGRLPLMVHCGDSRPQLQFSHPRHLAAVLKAFPALVVDAAHLGGWGVWDVAAPLFEHENCFFDVSSCLAFLDGLQLCAIARRYGTERVMFGSDFPIWDPARELQAVLEAGFTDAELEGILGGNCRRYLGV